MWSVAKGKNPFSNGGLYLLSPYQYTISKRILLLRQVGKHYHRWMNAHRQLNRVRVRYITAQEKNSRRKEPLPIEDLRPTVTVCDEEDQRESCHFIAMVPEPGLWCSLALRIVYSSCFEGAVVSSRKAPR